MGFWKKNEGNQIQNDVDLPDMSADSTLAQTIQQAKIKQQRKEFRARENADITAAENEGLPPVNRRSGNNKLVTIAGFVFIVGAAIALIVVVNGDKSIKKKKSVGQQEQIANNLPPIIVPPPPQPIAVTATSLGQKNNRAHFEGDRVPDIDTSRTQPIGMQTAANGKSVGWAERKMGGTLLVDAKMNSSNTSGMGGTSSGQVMMANENNPSAGIPNGGGQNELAPKLEPTVTKAVSASMLPDRNFLITKGTTLDCALETALDSSMPGLTTCRLTRDIYSDDGQVLLLDRGSQLVGEYQGGMKQGQTRIFVLWSRVKTPNGVVVNLNSPGTDALGRSGLDGWVDNHFAARFGAAILFSLMKDSLAFAAAKQQNGGGVVYGNTQASGEQIVGKVLDSTINIPPTLVKNQGDHIQVMVARDLDFSSVYGLRLND